MSATEGKSGLSTPHNWPAVYAKLSASTDAQVVAKADAFAARFGDSNVVWTKRRVVMDTFAPLAARKAALAIVMEQRDFQLAPLYHKSLTEPGLRLDALKALALYDVPAMPPAVLEVYATLEPDEKRAALSLLASRPEYARALLAAIKSGQIPASDVEAPIVRQLGLLKDAEIDQAVAAIWGTVHQTSEATAQEIARWKALLTPEKIAGANPAIRGLAVAALQPVVLLLPRTVDALKRAPRARPRPRLRDLQRSSRRRRALRTLTRQDCPGESASPGLTHRATNGSSSCSSSPPARHGRGHDPHARGRSRHAQRQRTQRSTDTAWGRRVRSCCGSPGCSRSTPSPVALP